MITSNICAMVQPPQDEMMIFILTKSMGQVNRKAGASSLTRPLHPRRASRIMDQTGGEYEPRRNDEGNPECRRGQQAFLRKSARPGKGAECPGPGDRGALQRAQDQDCRVRAGM